MTTFALPEGLIDSLGENHPDVANSHHNIAVNYRELGQFDEALMHGRKALEISLSNFTTDHTEVICHMQEIVETLLVQKQFAEALKEIEQLKKLAASNKKIKIAMLEMKGRIKQVGAKSGFRSRATKKYTTKKPKNA